MFLEVEGFLHKLFIKCLISICFITGSSYIHAGSNGIRTFENELTAKLYIVRVIHLFSVAIYLEKLKSDEIHFTSLKKWEKSSLMHHQLVQESFRTSPEC